jgi:alpha-L-rhamnosidase
MPLSPDHPLSLARWITLGAPSSRDQSPLAGSQWIKTPERAAFTFTIDQLPRRAALFAASDGPYTAFLNDQKLFDSRVDQHALTQHPLDLRVGENKITFQRGTGLRHVQQQFIASLQLDNQIQPARWDESHPTSLAPFVDVDTHLNKVVPPIEFTRTITVDKLPTKATLTLTAAGIYDIHVNGRRVGHYFAPGWTDYSKRLRYQTHDLTPHLRPGDNTLTITVADGWFSGNVGFMNRAANYYGNVKALLATLALTDSRGQTTTIATDESWLVRTGAIRRADLQLGEELDLTFAPADGSPAALEPQLDPPITITESLPAKIERVSPTRHLLDFAQNLAGVVELSITNNSTEHLTLRHAERLRADGSLDTDNLRRALATDHYTLPPGSHTLSPRFTYHGFRYAELTCQHASTQLLSARARVIHSDIKSLAEFDCADARLTRIMDNVRWSLRSNLVGLPTDCPQRDERMGWTGDAQIISPTALLLYDFAPIYRKWMIDIRDGITDTGAPPDTAPRVFSGSGKPGYADALCIVPYNTHLATGDEKILADNFDAMCRWIDLIVKMDPTLHGSSKPGFGDWVAPPPRVSERFLAHAYFARSCRIVRDVAHTLGRGDEFHRYGQLLDRILLAFAKRYISRTDQLTEHHLTAAAVALDFGLLDSRVVPVVVDQLLALVHAHGHTPHCGFVGTAALLRALSTHHLHDHAVRIALNENRPGWLYMLARGATTIWERWDAHEHLDNAYHDGPEMNSLNHFALGSIGAWFINHLVGIAFDPARPGGAHFLLTPGVTSHLAHARASHRAPLGAVSLEWKRNSTTVDLDITITGSSTATLFLPAARGFVVDERIPLAPGTHTISRPWSAV